MSIEAMKQAEKLLVSYQAYTENYRMANECGVIITTLRQAIEQAEKQEPEQENMCVDCGKPTMHMGNKCYGCCQTAQPEQEPVAYIDHVSGKPKFIKGYVVQTDYDIPLYTAPPRKPWVGLTDDEMHKIIDDCTPDDAAQEELNDFARAIFDAQAKLKEKNT